MGWGRALWMGGCVLAMATACAPHRVPTMDSGVRGPEGGVLTFDGAMLVHVDAARLPDAYVPGHDAHVGPSDAGHRCTGVAQPCTLVGSSSCTLQRGCTRTGDCTGVATGCYSLFDSFSCGSQDGCYWSSSGSYCSGSAYSCSIESGSSLCISQRGCSYTYTCTGAVTPCSLLGEFECPDQLGCIWE